jgi:hypothetical protein
MLPAVSVAVHVTTCAPVANTEPDDGVHVTGRAPSAVSVAVGVGLGLLAGFKGGWIDALLMRLCDVMLSFPAILVALLIAGVGRALFPNAVLEPIRLHVDAKRYLCRVDSGYWASLSPASKHSLELQGGIFNDADAEKFMAQPFAAEAVRLRRYDDLAKVKGKQVPGLAHFAERLRQVSH